VIAEPDNGARYWFSEPASGHEAFARAAEFHSLLEEASADDADRSIGPRVPRLVRAAGFEVLAVHLVPVSQTRVGAPVGRIWDDRRAAIAEAVRQAGDTPAADAGRALVTALERYAREAAEAGPTFLELQSTMLVVTIAQAGPEAPPPAPAPPGRGRRRG